jgi:predicted alpha/beta-hydrolase family hydrolase
MNKFLVNEPPGASLVQVVLAHGAGAPMDTPFMTSIAEGLSKRGILVYRFEFPYMARRRIDGKRRGPGSIKNLLLVWREVVREVKGSLPLFIGGKSMGGRLATMVADERGLSGLICLGYPFHPPGKPEKLRTSHLVDIQSKTLILQGERDPFGRPEEVASYDLSSRINIKWIPDGDHSLKPRKRSGYTEEGNLQLANEAIWDFVKEG